MNSIPLLLCGWLVVSSSLTWLDYSDVAYSRPIGIGQIFLYQIFIVACSLGLLTGYLFVGSRITAPHVHLGGSTFGVAFVYMPSVILVLLVSYAVVTYQVGVITDRQNYFTVVDQVTGRALIHLLPLGIAWHVYRERRVDRLAMAAVLLSLAYSLLYTERLYVLQVVAAVFLGAHYAGVFRLTMTRVVTLFSLALVVFVLSELSRSYVSSRLAEGEFSLLDGIAYSAKRFLVYYADPAYKSAAYLYTLSSQITEVPAYFDWETPLLTNRGGLWYLMNKFNVVPSVLFSLFLMFVAGIIFRLAKSGSTICVVTTPIFFMMVFEFPRVNFYEYSRFWLPLVALALYVVFVAAAREIQRVVLRKSCRDRGAA